MMAELAPPATPEPWERLVAEMTSARAACALVGDGNRDELAGCNGSGDLARLDTPELAASRAASGESTDGHREHGDASEVDTREREAAVGEGIDDRSQASAAAPDQVPDETVSVPAAPVNGSEEASALLRPEAMWERCLSMFTRGTNAPVSSGKGSLSEPATYELLMVIDDTAIAFIDAVERGELLLTAGPLDKIDTRGFLAADCMGYSELSADDAQKVGKRVKERVNSKRRAALGRT